jgi:AcrR family transcriptional regulator
MLPVNKEIWIIAGYETFALQGHGHLKVESLARQVGISKSSFYHHFVDLDCFVDDLLRHHLKQSAIIAEKERAVVNIDPELITVLLEHKIDLLFNRQLRIHKNNKSFETILVQSNLVIGESFKPVWIKELNLPLTKNKIDNLFDLALDNFFLQVNIDNLHYNWLSQYFSNLKRAAGNFV